MDNESCRMCGGDGLVSNSFGGSSKTCPSCHGNGRRSIEPLFRDVTKTKSSHHNPAAKVVTPKADAPTTFEGMKLADEIKASGLSDDAKAKLIREIMEYEGSHGRCTETFIKKMRKQFRPRAS
ncbi:MAG TPA: molecular chaperone DnaJ [Polyangiaceae bacterium]|nr:molecular chaperone DnaJ [Polyangiaceae bacterium]